MGLTNKLGLLAQSVQQDTSLNIGIGGAANASYKLQVTGATNLTGALSGTSATFSGLITMADGIGIKNSSNDLGIFASSNKLYFGTYSTALGLNINSTGAATFSSSVKVASSSTGGLFEMGSGANANSRSFRLASDVNDWGDFGIQVSNSQTGTTYTNALLINRSGNVGIGTSTDAGYKLDVRSTASSGAPLLANFQSAGGDPQVYVSNGTVTTQLTADNTNSISIVGSLSNHPLVIRTNNTERMRIAANGDVFIKTALRISDESTWGFSIYKWSTTGAPILEADGGQSISFANGGSEKMRISANGSIGAPNGTNIYNASDLRLKRNVTTITNGLDKINALNPVKFNWIDGFESTENEKDLLGFIAQEVQSVIPEAVEGFNSGNTINLNDVIIENPLRVNEKFIIPVLVKAIQELQERIVALESK